MYYAPRILKKEDWAKVPLLSSIGIGNTNLIFTLIGVSLIDKLGRRKLMYYGSFGYIISFLMLLHSFKWEGILIPFLFVFIASLAVGKI